MGSWRVVLAFILSVLAIAFTFIYFFNFFQTRAQSFILENPDQVAIFGSAGEYFNYIYGLPLAMVGAILGAIITLLASIVTRRQGDIQILEFVEKRIDRAVANYVRMIKIFEEMIQSSNRLRTTIEDLILTEIKRSEEEDRNPHGAEDIVLPHEGDLAPYLDDITKRFHALYSEISNLSQDTYTAMFFKRQIETLPPSHRPLTFLKSHNPKDSHILEGDFSENMYEVVSNLSALAEITELREFIHAYVQLPPGETSIEYAGFILYPKYLVLKNPITRKGKTIEGYAFNLGAAYILTLYQYFPTRACVKSVFADIFSNRSKVMMNFLDIAAPDKYEFGAPSFFSGIDEQFESLNRLIVVLMEDGNHEFYDPKQHGSIPKSGFEAG